MTEPTPITDETLFELLREADPLAGNPPPAVESHAVGAEGERLLQHIISRPGRRRARQRRRLVLSATFGGGVAAAAAATLVFTAGNAPSVAFAGWSASPTAPASGQLVAAEAACLARLPSSSDAERARADGTAHAPVMESLLKIVPSEWRVALSDTRGSFTMLILEAAKGQAQASCLSGSSPSSTTLSVGSVGGQQPSSPPEGQVTVVSTGSQGAVNGNAFTYTEGRVGADVTGITLVLADGAHVSATVANGLFLAWWPGSQQAISEEVATSSGTTSTQSLSNTLQPLSSNMLRIR
jgi:hypothetical protein